MKAEGFRIKFFNWSLALVFMTIPMPKYNLSTQAVILLFFAWIFVNSFAEKWSYIKANRKRLLSLIAIYGVLLVGMLYTENSHHGLHQLRSKLPLLLLPVILCSTSAFTIQNRQKYLRIFSVSVVLMAVFALCKSFYLHYSGLGNYFTYRKLAETLNKHPTYYSMFCLVSIGYLLYDLLHLQKIKKLLSVGMLLFLLYFIYLLSSRVAIVGLLMTSVYFVNLLNFNRTKKFLTVFAVLGVLIIVLLFSKNYTTRWQSYAQGSISDKQSNQLDTRLIHWKSTLQTLDGGQYIFGKGTGDGQKGLFQQYLKNNFKTGYKKQYNAHNQYLDFLMADGLIAVLAFCLLLGTTLIIAIRAKDQLGVLAVCLFVVFSLTESIMERQSGVMLVSLMCSFVVFTNKERLTLKREADNEEA